MNAPVTHRRDFLKASATAATAAALTRAIEIGAHAAEDGTIDVGIVGCGGRGTGAVANALSTARPTRLGARGGVVGYAAFAFSERQDVTH